MEYITYEDFAKLDLRVGKVVSVERIKGMTKYNFWNRSFNTIADMFAVNWMRKRRLNYEISSGKHD